jgi:hypothetical protein
VPDCRSCGKPLPQRAGRRGRASVCCSAACRQRADRSRHAAAAGELVQQPIADIERRVQRLAPHPPGAFYSDVTGLSFSVAKPRRIARLARVDTRIRHLLPVLAATHRQEVQP